MKNTSSFDTLLGAHSLVLDNLTLQMEKQRKIYNDFNRRAILELLDISYGEVINITFGQTTLPWKVMSRYEAEEDSNADIIHIRLVTPKPGMLGERCLNLAQARKGAYNIVKTV